MLNFLCSLLLQTHNRCRHETKCNVLDWACRCVSLKFMTLSHPRWLLGRPFWNWFLKLCIWCPELEFRSYSWAYRLKKWTFLWTTIGKMVKEKKKKKKKEKKSFPPQGLNPRRLHSSQGPYRLAICQFKSDVKCTVSQWRYFCCKP